MAPASFQASLVSILVSIFDFYRKFQCKLKDMKQFSRIIPFIIWSPGILKTNQKNEQENVSIKKLK